MSTCRAIVWQTAQMEKRQFLVCYDYGMGGLWGVIDARSEAEIGSVYPELAVAHERPGWMTEEAFAELVADQHHDIDGQPWGILNSLLADRARE